MSISIKDVLLIESIVSPSLILLKFDNKSPSLLVQILIKVDTWPTNFLSSKSDPPVVDNKTSLKQ